jgi:PmbA protein
MIAELLERAHRHAAAADAVLKTDETISVLVGPDGAEQITRTEQTGCYLRIIREGRVGSASSQPPDPDAMIAMAVEAADQADPGELLLPAAAALPRVITAHPAARSAGSHDLAEVATLLRDRMPPSAREVQTWAERSSGRVEVANTRGVTASYETSLVGIGLRVRSEGTGTPLLRLHQAGVAWPGTSEVERLVDEASRLLGEGLADREQAPSGPVWLAPRAVAAFIVPLRQSLTGQALFGGRSPFAGRIGETAFDTGFTLTDDPLAPGRPGSRPVDDDGVPCHRQDLVNEGVISGWITDLATGSRLGVPSTGHARWSGVGRPGPAYSNLVVSPGPAKPEELAGLVGDGVLVAALPAPVGDVMDGRIMAETPWAFRIVGGKVAGRLERVTLRGDVYVALRRIVAVGCEVEWIGAVAAPSLVVEGLEVA